MLYFNHQKSDTPTEKRTNISRSHHRRAKRIRRCASSLLRIHAQRGARRTHSTHTERDITHTTHTQRETQHIHTIHIHTYTKRHAQHTYIHTQRETQHTVHTQREMHTYMYTMYNNTYIHNKKTS